MLAKIKSVFHDNGNIHNFYKWEGSKESLLSNDEMKEKYEEGLILFGHNKLIIIDGYYDTYERWYEDVEIGDYLYVNERGGVEHRKEDGIEFIDDREYKIYKENGSYRIRKE